MSAKFNKNNKSWHVGIVPQKLYDDVEDLKDELDSLSANDVAYDSNTNVKQKIDNLGDCTLLGSVSNENDYKTITLSGDKTLDKGRYLYFTFKNTNNSIFNPLILPISIFRTLNSPSRPLTYKVNDGGNNYITFAYYVSDTSIKLYSAYSGYTSEVYMIR